MPSLKNTMVISSDDKLFILCEHVHGGFMNMRTAIFSNDGKSAYVWGNEYKDTNDVFELSAEAYCGDCNVYFIDHLNSLRDRLSDTDWIKLENLFPSWFKTLIETENMMRKLLE